MADSCLNGVDDLFLRQYQKSDLQIASKFLLTWLPFLTGGLCGRCTQIISDRVHAIDPEAESITSSSIRNDDDNQCDDDNGSDSAGSWGDKEETSSLGSWKDGAHGLSQPCTSGEQAASESIQSHTSWEDMVQEEEFLEDRCLNEEVISCPLVDNTKRSRLKGKAALSRDQREYIRFSNVKRKKDFMCFERLEGKLVNILQGLELHTGVFSSAEQKRIVEYIHSLEDMGRRGELRGRTYSAPRKWKRGKGRITMQFGCCYNYATDRAGNPPGIIRDETVEPIPPLFKVIIKRLVRWHVMPPTCVPDSCIVNIYDEGDCIPSHIDNRDFVRPFCTVSFVSECSILFGTNIKIVDDGVFEGPIAIPLPVGSVLVLNGNGADVAKHCISSVPTKRISITFRKMDPEKRPFSFVQEDYLLDIKPLPYDVNEESGTNSPDSEGRMPRNPRGRALGYEGNRFRGKGSYSEPLASRPRGQGRRGQW